MDQLDAFDRVLASLHEAALDDAHWPATAALLNEACRTKGNMLVFGERRRDDVVYIYLTRFYHRGQRRQDWEREYYEVYHPLDERAPRLNVAPDSQLMHVGELYTDEEKKTSSAYNEALAVSESQDSLNVRLDGPEGTNIVWAIADPSERDGWGSGQIELIEHLLPHLRQFVSVRQVLADAEALGASLGGLLDTTRVGVIHLDHSGRIVEANDRARDILQQGDGLFDRGGLLGTWLPEDSVRLQRLLGRALPRFGGRVASGSMTIQRLHGLPRLALHVSPVAVHGMDFGARRVAALVLVVDPARPPRVDPAVVAAALGLTPSESRVAALLAEGRSVREIAAAAGHQAGYVRWQLKRIYKKQGVSGQVALVQRVLSLPALSGTRR